MMIIPSRARFLQTELDENCPKEHIRAQNFGCTFEDVFYVERRCKIRIDLIELWESHPVFTLSLGVLSPLFPLFQLYPQMKEILLNLSMKC
jgi:hypothetical protein